MIGPVEKPRLEDLLVQTGAVEAQILASGDVCFQILVGGSGVNAVRVEALIQHQPLVDGLAV